MTKVGILTMHRVDNCGSALQAYATQHMVEKLGYECEIIDYLYPNVYQFERGAYRHPAWRNVVAPILWWLRPEWWRISKLRRFRKGFLKLSPFFGSPQSIRSAPPSYDIYMTGSDQVWNTRYTKGDTTFLLDFVAKKKKIAYAASFASGRLEECFTSSFRQLLQDYASISVREAGGKKIVRDLLGKDVPVVMDPTLLLDEDEWCSLSGLCHKNPYGNKRYILVYALDYSFNPAPAIYDVIRRIQEQTSYGVVSIGRLDERNIRDYRAELKVGPLEFLQLFKHASYVVTSSFHGTAFALNFGKRLVPIVCPSSKYDDRQITLLESLGISRCMIPSDMDVSTIDVAHLAELSVEGRMKLQELRRESIACLAGMLADV